MSRQITPYCVFDTTCHLVIFEADRWISGGTLQIHVFSITIVFLFVLFIMIHLIFDQSVLYASHNLQLNFLFLFNQSD